MRSEVCFMLMNNNWRSDDYLISYMSAYMLGFSLCREAPLQFRTWEVHLVSSNSVPSLILLSQEFLLLGLVRFVLTFGFHQVIFISASP